ncbi:MAG: T9SS C-terminal target domain-containing protein, partial [Calditrichaeota bacterium]
KQFYIFFLFFAFIVNGQSYWINEIHYDNSGSDTGEFVEVVIPQGANVNTVTLTLYNGSNGTSYGSHNLSTFTQGITSDGFTIYYKDISGIQNGSPDGMALDTNGVLIQFLSYEGVFTATDGPANGVQSTDIGVSETGSTPVGQSLQLLGSGTDYSQFTWGGPFTETKGALNSDGVNDQTLPVELTSFVARAGNNQVKLEWTTASEIENQGFVVLRSTQKEEGYRQLDSYISKPELRGAGTSNETHTYTFIDRDVFNGNTYWYKIVDVDNNGIRTEHGPVSATPQVSGELPIDPVLPSRFALYANRPNPFNPSTTIAFDVPALRKGAIHAQLTVHNLLGQKVATLYEGVIEAGSYKVQWNGRNDAGEEMPSGMYIYRLHSENFSQSRRMVLMK